MPICTHTLVCKDVHITIFNCALVYSGNESFGCFFFWWGFSKSPIKITSDMGEWNLRLSLIKITSDMGVKNLKPIWKSLLWSALSTRPGAYTGNRICCWCSNAPHYATSMHMHPDGCMAIEYKPNTPHICFYIFHITSHHLCWDSAGGTTNSLPHVHYMGVSCRCSHANSMLISTQSIYQKFYLGSEPRIL